MRFKVGNIFFPLATLSFIALTVDYLGTVFTPVTRWGFLIFLLTYILLNYKIGNILRGNFVIFLGIYLLWCVATAAWSEVPVLSIMKAIALTFVSITFVAGGQAWVQKHGYKGAIAFSAPVALVALLAGLLGRSDAVPADLGAGVSLYSGLTDNSNMFGGIVFMGMPFVMWQSYKSYRKGWRSWAWLTVLAVMIWLLALSHARSAMLATMLSGLGLVAAAGASRVISAALFCFVSALIFLTLMPSKFDDFEKRYLLKGAREEQGILFSRQRVWEDSYSLAVQGGVIGAGYGVTIGDTDFSSGFTAVGYGREKGNTQLAVVEETGIVGLVLYIMLLVSLFRGLHSAFLREADREVKAIIGLVSGTLIGLTVLSIFEAWWVAPGSPEAAYFWALSGVAIGLTQQPSRRRRKGPAAHVASTLERERHVLP